MRPSPVPSSLYHPSTASVPTSYYSMWHYKGLNRGSVASQRDDAIRAVDLGHARPLAKSPETARGQRGGYSWHFACTLAQGVRFDPELPQVLRMEFAKTNTKMLAKPKPLHHQHHHQQQQQQQLQAASSMSSLVLAAPPAFLNHFAARTYTYQLPQTKYKKKCSNIFTMDDCTQIMKIQKRTTK